MLKQDTLSTLYREMACPAFYPHPVSRVIRKETHISVVFLAGGYAYKLKKPLDLGFLDFRSLSSRRRFCQREVRLNRRLSSGIYLGVVPLYLKADASCSFEGPGKIIEYAVKMRWLPDAAAFRNRLMAKKMRGRLIKALGKKLSVFYEKSPTGPEIDRFGKRDVISANMEENFTQLSPYEGSVIDPEKLEFIRQVSRSFLKANEALFLSRLASGRIRDGHGDLRTDHVYFYRGIQIIDCIEFNDRFRFGDVAADIAFLYMDLDHYGLGFWGLAFLAAYVEFSGDRKVYGLIDFYTVYRAVVRLKICCLRIPDAPEKERKILEADARSYLEQALRYAVQFARPTLWITCGLPASGKSTLARGLCDVLSMEWIRSDTLRRDLFGSKRETSVSFDRGMYRSGMRDRVYAQMLALAQDRLRSGESVLLDATFFSRKWREAARLLAHDFNANLVCMECVCREATLRKRLRARSDGKGLSDARLFHLPKMTASFEPTTEMPTDMHFKVDTDRPIGPNLDFALSQGFTLKCRQIKARL